ncbi:hypothetical protein LR48_Vigan05g224900 [Vigna angularis]|uniref:Transcription factor bHLH25 Basic helix-loop-helix protein n=3 Tax=Phaseolus angularis TaxID=3914 RepID=A0A0L9UQ37_PHAAN|nr:transcription factor bHLH18 isoform X1 [Vigna angularis]KAG2370978.1 Transcription factor bHLH25 Basic helix-loop-helix protein [Vigna angularis]KOM44644.1 hypothetical protein LR48_Vigan05g224900 [Vigna angularis]BAT91466.1 hypothetical protein VIGAN_07006400 [Vigna angularis var. angularis]
MEQAWQNCSLQMEMDDDRHGDLMLEECHTQEEDFLREILGEPGFSSETETHHHNFTSPTDAETLTMVGSKSKTSSSPRTYILSFDSSTIIPATPQPPSASTLSAKKRHQNLNPEQPKPKSTTQTGKRTRNGSVDHIMAERRRRQELTERFIALSATIPGLKKTDKSSILGEAINYVKELKERVTELEERNKRGKESVMILKKSDVCESSERDSKDWCRMLPDIEARVMENEVLIEIHCEKEEGVELKLLDHLENLHLCVTATSVLPFGNSTLGITIIAQMGDAYKMTVNDVVKNLRKVFMNHMNINGDPY